MLFLQLICLAFSLAVFKVGSSIPARIAMIAIVIRSSVKVKYFLRVQRMRATIIMTFWQ